MLRLAKPFSKPLRKNLSGLKKFFDVIRTPKYVIILLFLIAFLARIPLLYTEFERENDSIDFINVADNLSSGKGYTRSVKAYYFDDEPVVASGSHAKQIFAPVVYSLLLKIKNDYYFLQFFILVIGAVNVVLFYLLARKFMNRELSFLAALLIALNPNLIIENRLIVSDQIFYFLVLLFFIVYYKFSLSKKKSILLGALAGFAYLTRLEGIILIVIAFFAHIKKPGDAAIVFLSFFMVCSPNIIINYLENGNAVHSYYFGHYSILDYNEARQHAYSPFAPPWEFIKENYRLIAERIWHINREILTYLAGPRFLGLMAVLLLLINYRKNFRTIRLLTPILAFFIMYYAIHLFTWSIFCCIQRHLASLYIFLVLVIFALWKESSRKVLYRFVIITVIIYLLYDFHQAAWIRKSIGVLEQKKNEPVYTWIRKNIDKDDIIAARYPYNIYLFTQRPSLLIPEALPIQIEDNKSFKNFLKKYDVKYVYSYNSDLVNFLDKEGKLVYKTGKDKVYCVFDCQ